MLKSTHKPPIGIQANVEAPLLEGWSEHKAPTGHSYYYNAATKKSTYTRPSVSPAIEPAETGPVQPSLSNQGHGFPHQGPGGILPNSSIPFDGRDGQLVNRGGFQSSRSGRGDHEARDRRPQPTDRPKSRHPIPGCEPWVLIHTKLGRRFVYNSEKNQSYWRIPDKLKAGILELDQQRIKEKADAAAVKVDVANQELPGAPEMPRPAAKPPVSTNDHVDGHDGDSSEYEEVEVTDDEEEGEEDEESKSKRQRTEDEAPDEPVEFNEDDIAFQLAAMGQEYGLEPGEYDDGHMEDWEEGVEGLELTAEDSVALFKDLLDDSGINPYSPWDKIVEDGKLVNDTRYTALTTMKSRKEVWEEWSRVKIKILQQQRAKEEKKDPRIPYMAFLQKAATPKLYWPEFKRKYKKEPQMRDATLSDKDREKWYREHINRLKLPASTLKTDLLSLLKSQSPAVLNGSTLPSHLPSDVLADVRYISIEPSTRDPLVEAFIGTLPPPPETVEEEDEEAVKARAERQRRVKALEDRERQVAEQKRLQQRNLEFGKGRLREEEAEIARAMNVTKKGLKDHLMAEDKE